MGRQIEPLFALQLLFENQARLFQTGNGGDEIFQTKYLLSFSLLDIGDGFES
jgi:hypothetical protein